MMGGFSPGVVLLSFFVLVAGGTSAQLSLSTVHVSPSGTDNTTCGASEGASACLTVTYSMKQLSGGNNTVLLGPGTYSECEARDGFATLSDLLTIQSLNRSSDQQAVFTGSACTTTDSNTFALSLYLVNNVVVRDVRFESGCGTNCGAIRIQGVNSAVLEGISVSGFAYTAGAGVIDVRGPMLGNALVEIRDSTISDSSSSQAALFFLNSQSNGGLMITATIENVEFVNCTSPSLRSVLEVGSDNTALLMSNVKVRNCGPFQDIVNVEMPLSLGTLSLTDIEIEDCTSAKALAISGGSAGDVVNLTRVSVRGGTFSTGVVTFSGHGGLEVHAHGFVAENLEVGSAGVLVLPSLSTPAVKVSHSVTNSSFAKVNSTLSSGYLVGMNGPFSLSNSSLRPSVEMKDCTFSQNRGIAIYANQVVSGSVTNTAFSESNVDSVYAEDIWARAKAQVTVTACTFRDMRGRTPSIFVDGAETSFVAVDSSWSGGVMFANIKAGAIFSGSNITISNFSGNPRFEGVLEVDGVATFNDTSIVDCNTDKSTVRAEGSGASLTLVRSTIARNTARGGFNLHGGGALKISSSARCTIDDSVIEDNIATAGSTSTQQRGGGGILLYNSAFVEIRNSFIRHNRVTAANGFGGGIYSASSTIILSDTVVSGNTAPQGQSGLALYIVGGMNFTRTVFCENIPGPQVSNELYGGCCGSGTVYEGFTEDCCVGGVYATQGQNITCDACVPGSFQGLSLPSVGSSCSPCANGTFSGVRAAACTDCSGNVSLATAGTPQCPCPGYYLNGSKCVLAPAGGYAPALSSVYFVCANGTISNQPGQAECRNCSEIDPFSTTELSATLLAAHDSQNDCQCLAGYGGSVPIRSCVPCAPGQFANTTSFGLYGGEDVSCEPCPIGSYQNESKQEVCVSCPVQSTTNSTGSFSFASCLCLGVGEEMRGGSCELCLPGTISPQNTPNCTVCVGGSYANTSGLGSCTFCPALSDTVPAVSPGDAGTILNQTGTKNTLEAAIGLNITSLAFPPSGTAGELDLVITIDADFNATNFTALETTIRQAIIAETGIDPSQLGAASFSRGPIIASLSIARFLPRLEHDSIQDCLCVPGSFGPAGTPCSVCSGSTYANAYGSANCTSCPARSHITTAIPDASLHDSIRDCECVPGTFGPPGGPCSVCVGSTYSNASGSATCASCPAGSQITSTDVSGHDSLQDCQCSPGTFGPPGGPCSVCVGNTFANVSGSVTCFSCPPGSSIFPASSNLTDHDSITDCRCLRGRFGPGDSSGCQVCSRGTYSALRGQTACLTCPTGQYVDYPGAADCDECPIDSTTINSTDPLNHDSASDCLCTKGRGFGRGNNCSAPCEPEEWWTASTYCTACPSANETGNAGISIAGCVCIPGFARDNSTGACKQCDPGSCTPPSVVATVLNNTNTVNNIEGAIGFDIISLSFAGPAVPGTIDVVIIIDANFSTANLTSLRVKIRAAIIAETAIAPSQLGPITLTAGSIIARLTIFPYVAPTTTTSGSATSSSTTSTASPTGASDSASSKTGLTGGAIAGIVFAVIFVVSVAFVLYYLKRSDASNSSDSVEVSATELSEEEGSLSPVSSTSVSGDRSESSSGTSNVASSESAETLVSESSSSSSSEQSDSDTGSSD